MAGDFDDVRWRRSRLHPDSDHRLRPARHDDGRPTRNRAWIAVALLVALIGVFIWILATDDGPDESFRGTATAAPVISSI